VVFQNKILSCSALLLIVSGLVGAQDPKPPATVVNVPLIVSAGVPLRTYVTKRLRMRLDEPVQAKLIDPIYAFDRIVVPAGAELQGHVTKLDPIAKMKRAQALLNGDFTPLHFARVEFTTITMPDGHSLPIHTADSEGLLTIYAPPRPSKKPAKAQPQNTGVLGTAKQQAQQQIQQQISARSRGVIDLVRSPNKKEWVEDYLIKKLPYHPQWYRRNTRFDSTLSAPLDFGMVPVSSDVLRNVGMPGGESFGQVRLLTDLSSAHADKNTQVSGVLSQPIFSPDQKLMIPEGTLLTGHVRSAQAARWFHRGGKLRFTFDRVDLPAITALPAISIERTPVLLSAAESDPRARVKVDSEGDAKATESKTRLLAPLLALIVASRASDNDAGRDKVGNAGGEANYGGRTTGGFSGFGIVGSLAAQGSKTVGSVLGYYGLGWTVYNTIVSRGNEVEFKKNTAISVRFGANPGPEKKPGTPFVADRGN
jgi:hypothetical protein